MSGPGTGLPVPRYAVTELEGYAQPIRYGSAARPGLSVQVLDRLRCHRVVWQERTEDYGPNTQGAKDWIRWKALVRCAELNGEPEPESFNRWRSHFRPTCPFCGCKCSQIATYCYRCKRNLYRQERGH